MTLLFQSIARTFSWLIEPSASISDPLERTRIRLIASQLLIIGCILGAAALLQILIDGALTSPIVISRSASMVMVLLLFGLLRVARLSINVLLFIAIAFQITHIFFFAVDKLSTLY